MLLLALLAAVVSGMSRDDELMKSANDCMSAELGGPLQNDFSKCELDKKMTELEGHGAGCNKGQQFVTLVSLSKQWVIYRGMDKASGFDDLIKFCKTKFNVENKDFFLYFQATGVAGDSLVGDTKMKTYRFEVRNHKDLEFAIDFSRTYGFKLKLYMDIIYNFREASYKMLTKQGDGRDAGMPVNRFMTFSKLQDGTDLKIGYYDTLRVIGANKWCMWELMINDKACPSGRITGTIFTKVSEDDHVPCTIVGICKNVPKTEPGKTHKLSVMLTNGGAGSDCYTGWYTNPNQGGFFMETEELLDGQHEIQYVQDYKIDNMSSGFSTTRLMSFTKMEELSYMRLFWKDNFRKYSVHGGWCRWGIYIDGTPSNNFGMGGIGAHIHTNGHDNDYWPKAVVGYIKVPKGEHKITVRVDRSHSSLTCTLGWGSNSGTDNWLMEMREVGRVGERVTWKQQYNQADGRDSSWINYRILDFDKLEDDTEIRFTYSDNFRVHKTSHNCNWEIRVNGASCPTGVISRSMHTAENDNDHQPGVIAGYCGDLKKGRHQMRIWLTSNSGHNNHDCYTGGYWGYPNNWVMEAEESKPILKIRQ